MSSVWFVFMIILKICFGRNEEISKRILVDDQSFILSELQTLRETVRNLTAIVSHLSANQATCNGDSKTFPTCNKHYTACPNGFTRHDSSCYKFFSQLMSFPEAMTYCHAVGSHLIRTETRQEFDFVRSWIATMKAQFTVSGAYVGALEGHAEGEWEWIETGTRMSNIPWSPGQPDEVLRSDCIVFFKDHNFYYDDVTCDYRGHFICEIDLSS